MESPNFAEICHLLFDFLEVPEIITLIKVDRSNYTHLPDKIFSLKCKKRGSFKISSCSNLEFIDPSLLLKVQNAKYPKLIRGRMELVSIFRDRSKIISNQKLIIDRYNNMLSWLNRGAKDVHILDPYLEVGLHLASSFIKPCENCQKTISMSTITNLENNRSNDMLAFVRIFFAKIPNAKLVIFKPYHEFFTECGWFPNTSLRIV